MIFVWSQKFWSSQVHLLKVLYNLKNFITKELENLENFRLYGISVIDVTFMVLMVSMTVGLTLYIVDLTNML